MKMGSVIVGKEKKVLTMAEYIERDELLKFKADVYDEDGHVLYAVPTGYIVAMPAADVATVQHGKWVDNGIPDSILSGCSVCGFTCGSSSFFYCPICGAKMDEHNEPEN